MNKETCLRVFLVQILILQWRAGKLPYSVFIHWAEKYWCSQKKRNMHFIRKNKMCHFISIWGLGRIKHSKFYWHNDTGNGKIKKNIEFHKIYILSLKILILVKLLLLDAYNDKNYLILQSLPTKQRSKVKIRYRKGKTEDIYWPFLALCFYYVLSSSLLS